MPDSTQDPRKSRQSLPRFYCPDLAVAASASVLSEQVAELDEPEEHHARRVLRLKKGDAVELFDGKGAVAQGVLEENGTVRVTELRHEPLSHCQLDLAVALPKGRHADDLIPMLSQLGVRRLIPLQTQRGVAQPGAGKLERFRRAALESAKQCRRAHVMAVNESQSMEQIMREPYGLRLIADPAGEPLDVAQFQTESILVLIGPEGGWTDSELALARRHGCLSWKFGDHILRIETAATAAAAICRYLTNVR